MVAYVIGPRHDRTRACYVWKTAAFCPLTTDHASTGINPYSPVCLATVDPSRDGCGEHGKKATSDEDNQSNQNAQSRECRLEGRFLFHLLSCSGENAFTRNLSKVSSVFCFAAPFRGQNL